MDALKTGITFLPLQFSRNTMEWQIAPATASLTSRAGLKYYLGINVPDFPGSSTLTTLTTLEGREKPPVTIGGATSYPGAFFRIDELLDTYLEAQKPGYRLSSLQILNQLTMPYQLREQVQGGTPTQNTDTTSGTQWLFKGGIADEDTVWQDRFFHEYLRDTRQFLTWQPTTKTISADQEEYLYFLFNFTPPATIKLRVEINWRDGSTLTRDAMSLAGVPLYSVLCCPVGPLALGLDDTIASYSVWLSNGDNERLSEGRTFYLESKYRPQTRHLLFCNSLSGWDTLRLLGKGEESTVVQRQTAQLETFGQTGIEAAQLRIVDIKGDTHLTVSTGWFERDSEAMAAYLAELLYSEAIYLITPKGHVPVILSTSELQTHQDDGDLVARTFTFERTKPERNFSNLPASPTLSTIRPTGWVGVDTQVFTDAYGKRTGYQQPVRLRKQYTDTNTDFLPLTEKPNLPGDPDYIPPTLMVGVTPGSTPYPSAAISRAGTFRRSDCALNQTGGPGTITVASGKYGSEISQADADSKAEAEYAGLNTQAYADAHGSCTLATYQSNAISLQGTFQKNNCGSTYAGTTALITVAAGKYGSEISQADADSKATAEYNQVNTQAYANANGSCVALPASPSGLNLTGKTTSSLAIAWSNVEAGSYATEVQHSTDQGNWSSFTTSAGATSRTITGLSQGVRYYIRIRSLNIGGYNSAWTTANFTTSTPPSVGAFSLASAGGGNATFNYSTQPSVTQIAVQMFDASQLFVASYSTSYVTGNVTTGYSPTFKYARLQVISPDGTGYSGFISLP